MLIMHLPNFAQYRYGLAVFVAILLLVGQVDPVLAQNLQIEKSSRLNTLDSVSKKLTLGRETVKRLEAEIALLKKDREKVTQTQIDIAKRMLELEGSLNQIEQKLDVLKQQEADVKLSLVERRSLLSQVLAALQRMGRKPPPALLVRPHDALASIRSAVLLGAVVPEMKAETSILIADLQELVRLRKSIQDQREQYSLTIKSLTEDDTRLSLLVDEKLKLEGSSREKLKQQADKNRELAARASSLKQLIASFNLKIAEAERVAKAAREASEAQARQANERLATARSKVETGRSDKSARIARLKPSIKFSQAKGLLQLPVNGVEVLSFGEKGNSGAKSSGALLATRANALVISPVDAKVVYAGPFRSYGKLLILDVGDQVHVILAGMGAISVGAGQIVLAGEPIAKMGTRRFASAAAVDIASSRPMLYVEFRKDGKSFDPSPWWADKSKKRSSNDS